jgi:hypothetical protein
MGPHLKMRSPLGGPVSLASVTHGDRIIVPITLLHFVLFSFVIMPCRFSGTGERYRCNGARLFDTVAKVDRLGAAPSLSIISLDVIYVLVGVASAEPSWML